MKYRLAFLVIAVLIATPALAQQPQASAEVRACSMKLSNEINSSLQAGAALFTMQDELAKLRARVAELEAKYEPKKPSGPEAAPNK